MSAELLLLAGEPTAAAQAMRRRVVTHAAGRFPHVTDTITVENRTAVAAVVVTAPGGGTLSIVERAPDGQRLVVATADAGLAAARHGGPCGAEAGHVAVLLRDAGDVVLSTDGVGFIPCYWGRPGNGLVVSTHLASLVSLGLSPEPDEQGVVEYVVTQSPIGLRTLLREATMLVAGGRLHWGPGTWSAPLAASPFSPSEDHLSDGDVIETFAGIWPQVVGDAFAGRGRTVIGLSGGLDSRAIAEGAVGGGLRPLTYTYGTAPSRDPLVAAEVAGALGLPHVSIPVVPERLLAGGVDALDLLDGAHSPSEMYELWFGDVLADFADTIVNGNAGGPLWGDDKALGLTTPEAVVGQRLRGYAGAMTAAMPYLDRGLAAEAPALLRRGLSESLAEWDLAARPDHLIFWRVMNRQFRWGNMLTNALRRVGIRPEAPFLDSRFLALAARFSLEQRRNGRLYLEVHRRLFSLTSRIPRADDGNPPRALNHVYWTGDTAYVRQLGSLAKAHPISGARRAVRQVSHEAAIRLERRAGVAGPARRSAAQRAVFPADVWLRDEPIYADRLSRLLEAGDHALLAQSAVEAALAQLRAGRVPGPALVLGKVAAARAWLADYERRAAALLPELSSRSPHS